MRRIVWSDNIGTVGWTSIHAIMGVADMEWLLEMEPRGSFLNTFYPGEGHAKGSWCYSWRTSRGMIENMRSAGDERGFYFHFPEDKDSLPLLAALRLMGMSDRVA